MKKKKNSLQQEKKDGYVGDADGGCWMQDVILTMHGNIYIYVHVQYIRIVCIHTYVILRQLLNPATVAF